MSIIGTEREPGDFVRDLVEVVDPDAEAGTAMVMRLAPKAHADEYYIPNLDQTVAEAAGDDWPIDHDEIPADYDPDTDGVIEVVFCDSLYRKFGVDWEDWGHEGVRRALSDSVGGTTYAYHARRLISAPAPY